MDRVPVNCKNFYIFVVACQPYAVDVGMILSVRQYAGSGGFAIIKRYLRFSSVIKLGGLYLINRKELQRERSHMMTIRLPRFWRGVYCISSWRGLAALLILIDGHAKA